jgi:hypothetical protein
MLACTRTGQFVTTGIETDLDTFIALPEAQDQVPRMRQRSLLDKKPNVDLQHAVFVTGIFTCRNSLQSSMTG